MATPLLVKRTSVPGREPTISNIDLGEIAFNTHDGRVFIKKSQNGAESIVELGSVTSVNGQQGNVVLDTDDVAEGSGNQYFTAARSRSSISVNDPINRLAYNSNTGELTFTPNSLVTKVAGRTGDVTLTTTDVAEGSNLYFNNSRARAALSGSGNIQYDPNTGVINVDTSNFVTFTGTETVANKMLETSVLKSVKESTVALGNSGTAKTLDLTNGSFQTVTMTGNCVFTMPPVDSGKYFTLFIDTGAGGFTGTFPGAKFPGNTPPELTTKADCADMLAFISDGVNWYGNLSQRYVLRVTYNVAPVASSVNEGSSLVFNVNTNNFEDGTLYWTVNGASAADFVAASGTVSITSESGSFSITTVADLTTEGAETFRIDLRTGSVSGPVVASSSNVTINDTSRTPPTYAVAPNASSVNEGSSVGFTVTTTDFDDGPLYWTVEGAQSGDFGSTSGTVNMVNNSGSFSVSAVADLSTEGSETFRVRLRTGSTSGTIVATSSYVTINDTSVSPTTYAVSPNASSVNEGNSVTFTVTTTYFGTGTLYWTVDNSSTSSADFSSTSGSVNVNNDSGTFSVTTTADQTAEGAETFRVQLRTGSTSGTVVATSSYVTINDTSVPPAAPVATFLNGGFENGDFTNWTTYDEQVSPGGVISGVRSTILNCPIPADLTPYPVGSGSQVSPGQSPTFSGGTFTTQITTPGYVGSYCANLSINGGTTVPGGTVYGPVLVSNNPVIAAVGDRLSFWWKAEGGGDAFNVLAYAIDPSQSCKIIRLLDATGDDGANYITPWNQVTRVIGSGEAGNYYFVFICGTFDYSFGTAVGAALTVDEIQLQKAGTF